MNILIEKLKALVQKSKNDGKNEQVIINEIKEYLQFPVLNFVYNTPGYSNLVMYGGTLLRIGYGLERMSEDLDFQTNKPFDFEKFKSDLTIHFKKTEDIDVDIAIKKGRLAGTDFAVIKFSFLNELGLDHVWNVLKVRFDVNDFSQTKNFSTEIVSVTKDFYVFSIKTYPISTLMASKIAAVLLRTARDIGDEKSDCKPRDVYDLMWYMQQKILPNMEYLKAIFARNGKILEAKNILDLFDQLALRVFNINDHAFKSDLLYFFRHAIEYDAWHRNWKQRFQMLKDDYPIHRVKDLKEIRFSIDYSSDNHHYLFRFSTEEPQKEVKFSCGLSEYWYFSDLSITKGYRRPDIESKIANPEKMTDLDYEYLGLFYSKIEDYLNRNDRIVTQSGIQTKLIRATGDNLNTEKEIMLDHRLLEKTHFENLI